MSTYSSEAAALDGEILRIIERWHHDGLQLDDAALNDLSLRIFAHQLRYNEAYARYAGSFGVTLSAMPRSWEAIPAVPTAAYKEAILSTFDPAHAALTFVTSGTTQGTGGRHFMETTALYDAALMAGFDRFALVDAPRLRYLNLVPNPHDRPESSLGYMMARVAAQRGDGQAGWYLRGDELFFEAFIKDVQAAIDDAMPVAIATTAFALVQVLDLFRQHELHFTLPAGSRIMETGGFKGRTRVVSRDDLYDEAASRFNIARSAIFAEYGMTELTSQYYDTVESRDAAIRIKVSPPWLRPRVVGSDGKTLPKGTVGSLVHVDLANRSSCIAIATEDLGIEVDGGIVLIGREQGAALRGCSLDAEELHAALR
ncbi:MAG: LuxE/PaaK family acyltransferase [Vulcanimicrobiaceae bacterium]